MSKPLTVFITHSAHTDIGFTHPQDQILRMYLDHYDQVLALCAQTSSASPEQRFKWTCETAWQVRHYLTERPERTDEFVAFAQAGQIDITAGYLHFTDLIDLDAYHRSLEWGMEFCAKYNLPFRCVVHSDINGWPWGLADLLEEHQIPFFCSQTNLDMATAPLSQRGSVDYHSLFERKAWLHADAPIRVPQAFWWQGPNGGKVLHWLGEGYLVGNNLGLSGNYSFNADKTRYYWERDPDTADDLYQIAKYEVPRYLNRLLSAGYSLDIALINTAGYYVDNSPPDSRWLEIIARWNADHDDVKLRSATLSEWFAALLERDTGQWPTYDCAWPDHWSHGLGASTERIAQARRTQRRRSSIDALVKQTHSEEIHQTFAAALEQERLALEHTFNVWSSITKPDSPESAFQQAAKELYFHRAELYLDEAVGSALRSLTPASTSLPSLYVYVGEALPAPRLVHFSLGDVSLDPDTQVLMTESGQVCRFQSDTRGEYVLSLPSGIQGLVALRLDTVPTDKSIISAPTSTYSMVNPNWHLMLDPGTGGLSSLIETSTGREWVDKQSSYAFGQFVHEVIVHPLGREAVHNLARYVALGVANQEGQDRLGDSAVFAHRSPQMRSLPLRVQGPVFDSLVMQGENEPFGQVRLTWRCYHAQPVVELVVDWTKNWCSQPEASYIAFPFAAANGQLKLEAAGGFFQPGSHKSKGQLPGTCANYYTTQRAAHIISPDGLELLWLPLDAPLVMPNVINYANWEPGPWDWNGFLASMPVNHYWLTNFSPSQRGHMRLRYRLISRTGLSDVESAILAASPIEALGWR